MNRLLLATCAVAAFAANWVRLQHGAPDPVRDPASSLPVVADSFTGSFQSAWPGLEPMAAPARVPVATVDELVLALDADLGDEGVPVNRQAIERALGTDPDLREALGLP